jgi:hypothetical protein
VSPAVAVATEEWRTWTDGACHANPGPRVSVCYWLAPMVRWAKNLPEVSVWATCNVVEYQALIEALRLARVHGAERLAVFSDSTLIVEQMAGRWRVRHAGLKPCTLRLVSWRLGSSRCVTYGCQERGTSGRTSSQPWGRHGSDPKRRLLPVQGWGGSVPGVGHGAYGPIGVWPDERRGRCRSAGGTRGISWLTTGQPSILSRGRVPSVATQWEKAQ